MFIFGWLICLFVAKEALPTTLADATPDQCATALPLEIMNRFVRSSKYRHVYGSARKREQCYDNLNISFDSNDSHLAHCNGKYLSVHWSAGGGGAFAVLPVEVTGRLPADVPLFEGHSAPVLDTAFSPFNDDVVASTGEDGRLLVWNIPQPGQASEGPLQPALSLQAHERRAVDIKFHPTAENVLATASHDQTVRLWDLEKASCRVTLDGHGDAVLDQSWSWTGAQLATSSRDKHLRVWDPRSNVPLIAEVKAHEGVKGVRVVWLGRSQRIATTGFSRTSDRQLSIWDARNMSAPLKTENLDTSSGLLMPHYDADTQLLFLSGRGDGNIRYYEIVDEAPYAHFVAEYKSTEPQRAVTFLPKRAVSVSENEIARAYKVHTTGLVEPVSFRVPRKGEGFQSDIFPETPGPVPALSASAFFDERRTAEPVLISLAAGYAPALRRDFTVSLDGLDSQSRSASGLLSTAGGNAQEEELVRLRAENAQLRAEVEALKARLQ